MYQEYGGLVTTLYKRITYLEDMRTSDGGDWDRLRLILHALISIIDQK